MSIDHFYFTIVRILKTMKIVNGKDDIDQDSSLDRWKKKRKINIEEFYIPDCHQHQKKKKDNV